MRTNVRSGVRAFTLIALCALGSAVAQADGDHRHDDGRRGHEAVQLGPRPFYLVKGMDDGALKHKLMQCENGPFYKTDFSIAHRGAPLQFPEHTQESYEAGAKMGAGIVECDLSFTKDGHLVCRHSECDLHTTTNIVATELNNKCSVPWSGAGSSPQCCTSDLTLDEYKSLTGKMDAANPAATTAAGYLGGTAPWRTDLYAAPNRGTLLTFRESIALNQRLGVKHTPELKGGNPARIAEVFGGQEQYAQAAVNDLIAAGVRPKDVWLQSFDLRDVLYWINHAPAFGRQAVYLDDVDPTNLAAFPPLTFEELKAIRAQGVRIFAPPIPALLTVTPGGEIVPSQYARDIRRAGLDIITWSFERSDLRRGAKFGGFYAAYDPEGRAVRKDSDMYKALDVLARKVGVLGIFSDWPATVSYYASCMKLK